MCLEVLERPWNVENRLGSRAEYGHTRATQFCQISGNIHRAFSSTMNASNATRGKYTYTGSMCKSHGAADCGATDPAHTLR